ncbi:hypothetical protein [Paenibacillus silviterrae]|uniref:hypothetical protein n=1 Tax=Paenibacillus silviterrae TaxID=3242194 RepID=UPI002543725B|nr:hypothetical protein [Paenibacillus chinjuensis]
MNPTVTPKHPMVAFLLSFIPGLGFLYLGKLGRGLLYGCGFFGPLGLLFLALLLRNGRGADELLILPLFSVVIALINLIDMARTVSRSAQAAPGAGEHQRRDQDRGFTIALSFIPGLGHLQLGLMQRGLSLLISFIGFGMMIIFITAWTKQDEFLAFLGILPVFWIYSMFDVIQQLNRKERGEELADRSVFEDFQDNREAGKRNKLLATLLCMFPGAGHMYLGFQKRGLQLMAAFLFSIYIMDVLRLSIFLFLIPILWFYSFFDGLQHISKHGKGDVQDVPIVDWLIHHQRWVGFGLLALGAYYLFDQVILGILEQMFPDARITYRIERYFQTVVVSLLFIGGGIRLLAGSKGKKEGPK